MSLGVFTQLIARLACMTWIQPDAFNLPGYIISPIVQDQKCIVTFFRRHEMQAFQVRPSLFFEAGVISMTQMLVEL